MKKLICLLFFCFGLTAANAQVNVTLMSLTASCDTPCVGALDFYGTGGAPPYSFYLSPVGGMDPQGNFYGLCQGSYTVTLIDNNGNIDTMSVSIGGFGPTVTGVTVTPVQPFSNYQAQVNYNGGISPYQVTWYSMPSQTVIRIDTTYNTAFDTISNLPPGDYAVSVIEWAVLFNACQNVIPQLTHFSVCDNAVGSGVIQLTGNDTVCTGTSVSIMYIPLPFGPVQIQNMIFFSDNPNCDPASSGGTFSCTPTQTTTFSGLWFYSSNCPPITFPPLTVVVDPCLSTADAGVSPGVDVFPNPSEGSFTVTTTSNEVMTLNVFDNNGHLVYSKTVVHGEKITTDLSAGIYFAEFTDGTQRSTKKLVITRE